VVRPKLTQTAFTLLELLVVITIIGLVAALLLPSLGTAKERARRATCKTRLRQLTLCCHMYADDNRQWLPSGASNNGPNDDHIPVISNVTSNNLMAYLKTRTMLVCPGFAKLFTGSTSFEKEGAGYGFVMGYNYHGGHTNTPWAPLSFGFTKWVSPMRSTELPNMVLFSDMNDLSRSEGRTFAPHTKTGPLLKGGDQTLTTNRVSVATFGTQGGNIALLDGSVEWKPVRRMRIYRGSQLWGDDGCIAMW